MNHPARVAERVAMLDHLSEGRFEFGIGRGSSSTEYQGFGIPDADTTRDLFDEALPEVAAHAARGAVQPRRRAASRCRSATCCRSRGHVPHPPLWLACGSPATFEKAGRLGMGALCFTMGDPEDLAPLIETYKNAISECTEPVGAYVNDNVACVSMLLCLEDRERARRPVPCTWAAAHYQSLVVRWLDSIPLPVEHRPWPSFTVPEPSLDELDESIDDGPPQRRRRPTTSRESVAAVARRRLPTS